MVRGGRGGVVVGVVWSSGGGGGGVEGELSLVKELANICSSLARGRDV